MNMKSRAAFTGIVLCTLIGCEALPANPFQRTQFRAGQAMYEVHYCRLLESREFECEVTITSFNNAKTISSGGIKIRDDAGNEYVADNPGYGGRIYAPEERFRHTLRAGNVSTQAKSVTAITGGLTVSGGPGAPFRGVFILSGIENRVAGAGGEPDEPATAPDDRPRRLSVREADAVYEVHGCTLLPSREFSCDVSVTNFNQEKTVRTGSITIRDDLGNDYAVQDNPSYPSRTYAPGEQFRHTIRASNIAAKAHSVAAVHGGFIVRGPKSYRGEFILYGMDTREGVVKSGPVVPGTGNLAASCVSRTPANASSRGLKNLALQGLASQSSTGHFRWDATAGLANDGNTNGDYYGRSVAHTLKESGAWWQIDLGTEHALQEIVIWNRTDRGWGKRLTNFSVLVSDSAGRVTHERSFCDNGRFVNPAMVLDLPSGVSGQYVKIRLNGDDYLQLAEVEVLAVATTGDTSGPVVEVPATPAPAESLLGCWQWSNSMLITVNAGGTANNGFASGPWSAGGNNSYAIRWPDFIGKVTLSPDGQTLTSVDALGARSSAERLDGSVTSLIGSWRWDNGGIVAVSPDGSVSAGDFKGAWSGAARNYQIAWPIIDAITVSDDGKRLSGSNQFGSFTAQKQATCE